MAPDRYNDSHAMRQDDLQNTSQQQYASNQYMMQSSGTQDVASESNAQSFHTHPLRNNTSCCGPRCSASCGSASGLQQHPNVTNSHQSFPVDNNLHNCRSSNQNSVKQARQTLKPQNMLHSGIHEPSCCSKPIHYTHQQPTCSHMHGNGDQCWGSHLGTDMQEVGSCFNHERASSGFGCDTAGCDCASKSRAASNEFPSQQQHQQHQQHQHQHQHHQHQHQHQQQQQQRQRQRQRQQQQQQRTPNRLQQQRPHSQQQQQHQHQQYQHVPQQKNQQQVRSSMGNHSVAYLLKSNLDTSLGMHAGAAQNVVLAGERNSLRLEENKNFKSCNSPTNFSDNRSSYMMSQNQNQNQTHGMPCSGHPGHSTGRKYDSTAHINGHIMHSFSNSYSKQSYAQQVVSGSEEPHYQQNMHKACARNLSQNSNVSGSGNHGYIAPITNTNRPVMQSFSAAYSEPISPRLLGSGYLESDKLQNGSPHESRFNSAQLIADSIAQNNANRYRISSQNSSASFHSQSRTTEESGGGASRLQELQGMQGMQRMQAQTSNEGSSGSVGSGHVLDSNSGSFGGLTKRSCSRPASPSPRSSQSRSLSCSSESQSQSGCQSQGSTADDNDKNIQAESKISEEETVITQHTYTQPNFRQKNEHEHEHRKRGRLVERPSIPSPMDGMTIENLKKQEGYRHKSQKRSRTDKSKPLKPLDAAEKYPGGTDKTELEIRFSDRDGGVDASAHKINKKRTPVVREDNPCTHCGITESCTWRPGPLGRSTLCNTCGYYFRRRQCLSEKRKDLYRTTLQQAT